MQAASLASRHRDRSAGRAIAFKSAADAMLARTNAGKLASGNERGRRLFLPSTAHLADIRSAALSRSPIERGEVCFRHSCNVAMLGGARKRQIMLVLSALLAYVIVCRFWHGAETTKANENKVVKKWVS